RVQFRNDLRGTGRSRVAASLAKQIGQTRGVESLLAREDFVKHQTMRIDVALRRQLLPFELFRRHVRGRSGDLAPVFFGECGDAEVSDAYLAVLVEHD